MTLPDFKALIETLDIPSVYGYYKDNESAAYITYMADMRNVIHADGIVVYSEDWITLRLVTKKRDMAAEAQIEQLLNENGITFGDPDYLLDEEQGIHIATYNFMIGG